MIRTIKPEIYAKLPKAKKQTRRTRFPGYLLLWLPVIAAVVVVLLNR